MFQTNVVIEEFKILSAYDDRTTISSIVDAAMNEWRLCNVSSVKRPRFVRDQNGRVIPGHFLVMSIPDRSEFEVVLHTIDTEVKLSTSDILQGYRSFQSATVSQLMSYLTTLHFRDHSQEPDTITYDLIEEFVSIPASPVQLSVLELIKFLMLKFTNRNTLFFATRAAVRMFNETIFSTVANVVLDLLIFSSTNLVSLVHDNSMLKVDREEAIRKFPDEARLLDNLNKLYASEQDITLSPMAGRTHSMEARSGQKEVTAKESGDHVITASPSSEDLLPNNAPLSAKKAREQASLNRILSMISSSDSTSRRFGLQKLLSKLILLKKISRESFEGSTETKEPSFQYHTAQSHRAGQRPHIDEIRQTIVCIASRSDVRQLSDTLFRSLKTSLDSRAAANYKDKKMLAAAQKQRLLSLHIHDHNSSTASMLIDEALASSSTDVPSIMLIMQCFHTIREIDIDHYLWSISGATSPTVQQTTMDSTANLVAQLPPFGATGTLQQFVDLDPELIRALWGRKSPPPRLFLFTMDVLECARDWLKLLVTLAHSNDSRVAEVCADIASQSILHIGCLSCKETTASNGLFEAKKALLLSRDAVYLGWESAGIQLEEIAILYFLRPTMTSYFHRCQLAISYVLYHARYQQKLKYIQAKQLAPLQSPSTDNDGRFSQRLLAGFEVTADPTIAGNFGSSAMDAGSINIDAIREREERFDRHRQREKKEEKRKRPGDTANTGNRILFDDIVSFDNYKILSRLQAISVCGLNDEDGRSSNTVFPSGVHEEKFMAHVQHQNSMLDLVSNADNLPDFSTGAKLFAIGTVPTYMRICALECLAAAGIQANAAKLLIEAEIVAKLLQFLEELATETEMGNGLVSTQFPIFNSTIVGLIFGDSIVSTSSSASEQIDESRGSDEALNGKESFYTLMELLKFILKSLSNLLLRSDGQSVEDVISLLQRLGFTCVLPDGGNSSSSLLSVAELCRYDDILQFYYSMIINISTEKDGNY